MRKDKFKKKTNEERKVELTTALQKLEDGVVDMFTSDRYKEYLRFFSQTHNYGQMKRYEESLKNTPDPIVPSQLSQINWGFRKLMNYAKSIWKKVVDLTVAEKRMFIKNKKCQDFRGTILVLKILKNRNTKTKCSKYGDKNG